MQIRALLSIIEVGFKGDAHACNWPSSPSERYCTETERMNETFQPNLNRATILL